MFTGIVRQLGTVTANSGRRLAIRGRLGKLPRGASVSINGTCLTVVAQKSGTYDFEVSPETLKLTNLGNLNKGDRVNLEPSLKAGDQLGGHWVSGHVDARTKVLEIEKQPGGFVRFRVALPTRLARFVVYKGSVAVDGTSLTVTKVGKKWFESVLIPETLERTTLGRQRTGGLVNIEIDVFARYLDSLLQARGIR
jgi:riboflavin synthase